MKILQLFLQQNRLHQVQKNNPINDYFTFVTVVPILKKVQHNGLKRYYYFFNNVLYVALSRIILELPGTIALFIKWIAFIYFLKSHFGPNKKKKKKKKWIYCNGISLSHTTSEKKHVLGLKTIT